MWYIKDDLFRTRHGNPIIGNAFVLDDGTEQKPEQLTKGFMLRWLAENFTPSQSYGLKTIEVVRLLDASQNCVPNEYGWIVLEDAQYTLVQHNSEEMIAQLINFARYADRVAAIFSEAIHQEAKDSPPWDNISDIKDAKPK